MPSCSPGCLSWTDAGAQLAMSAAIPSGPGPAVTQIEECLSAVCASADVRAACIACAWLPDRISDQTTREAITRLARALGTDLAWREPTGR